jgi:hypothetical protein
LVPCVVGSGAEEKIPELVLSGPLLLFFVKFSLLNSTSGISNESFLNSVSKKVMTFAAVWFSALGSSEAKKINDPKTLPNPGAVVLLLWFVRNYILRSANLLLYSSTLLKKLSKKQSTWRLGDGKLLINDCNLLTFAFLSSIS